MTLSAILQQHRIDAQNTSARNAKRLHDAHTPNYQRLPSAASAGAQGGLFAALQTGLSNLAQDVLAREQAEIATEKELQSQKQAEMQAQQNLALELSDSAQELGFKQSLEEISLTAKNQEDFLAEATALSHKYLGHMEYRPIAEQKTTEAWLNGQIQTGAFGFVKKQHKQQLDQMKVDDLRLFERRLGDLSTVAYNGDSAGSVYESGQMYEQIKKMQTAGMLTPDGAMSMMQTIQKTIFEQSANGEFDRAFEVGVEQAFGFLEDFRGNESIAAEARQVIGNKLASRLSAHLKDRDRLSKAQDAAETKVVRQTQAAAFAQTITAINKPDVVVSQSDVDQMLIDRKISEAHYSKLVTALNGEQSEESPQVWLSLIKRVYDDTTDADTLRDDVYAAFAYGTLSEPNMEKVLGMLEKRENTIENDREKVTNKQNGYWLKYLQSRVGGVRGVLAVLDGEASRREASAVLEYHQLIETMEISGATHQEIVDDLILRYGKPTEQTSPSAYLSVEDSGDVNKVSAALSRVEEDYHSGSLSKEDFENQVSIIRGMIGQ